MSATFRSSAVASRKHPVKLPTGGVARRSHVTATRCGVFTASMNANETLTKRSRPQSDPRPDSARRALNQRPPILTVDTRELVPRVPGYPGLPAFLTRMRLSQRRSPASGFPSFFASRTSLSAATETARRRNSCGKSPVSLCFLAHTRPQQASTVCPRRKCARSPEGGRPDSHVLHTKPGEHVAHGAGTGVDKRFTYISV